MDSRDGRAPGYPDEPWLDALVSHALVEDIGSGDVTTIVAVDPAARAAGAIVARQSGVVCGLPLVMKIYARISGDVAVTCVVGDGAAVEPGDVVATIRGPVAPILTGERTALNALQYLSGIATQARLYARETAGTPCRVLDTRKTLPGYRRLAKYAVRCGGGTNHRMGLHDRILLKDNHWAAREGSLADLVARGRALYPELAIEVEVDTLDQLVEVLPLRVEWVLLDNFDPGAVAEAVRLRDARDPEEWRTRLEASGNVDLTSIRAYARAGADAASVGRLTHSVPALDLGLDLEPLAGGTRE